MTPKQRTDLLELVNAGLEIPSAAAQLSIRMDSIRKAGKRFGKQLDEAFNAGTARLSGWLLTAARSENDTKVIGALLERREQATAGGNPVTCIERIIVDPGCPKCGYEPAPHPGNGAKHVKLSDRGSGIPESQDDLAVSGES